jgi:hypothetical protein
MPSRALVSRGGRRHAVVAGLLAVLAVLATLMPVTTAGQPVNLVVTLSGAGGDPLVIADNGALDMNPAVNVIEWDDPLDHFMSQQSFGGVGGARPRVTAAGTDTFFEVVLTDLQWNNFNNPSNSSSVAFSLTWNNLGGLGDFFEDAGGTWSIPPISAGAPALPAESPTRGTITQLGTGGGVNLSDDQSDQNNTHDPKVVPIALADGSIFALWPAAAPVTGSLEFDVTNDVGWTVGTHVVTIPGSAHWRGSVTAVPEPAVAPLVGAGVLALLGLLRRAASRRTSS